MCNLVFDPRYTAEIDQEYFDAASRAAAVWHSSGIGGALYPQVIAQQMAQIDRNLVGNPTPGSLAQNQGQSNGNVDLTTITYAPNKDNTGVNILLGANVKNSSDKELNWIQSITTNAPNPGKPANTPYLDTPPVGAPTIFYYHSGDMGLFAIAHDTTGYSATFFDAPSKPRSEYPNAPSTIKLHAELRLVGISPSGNYHTLLRLSYGFTLDAKGIHTEPLRIRP
jgi:hypothetical protein